LQRYADNLAEDPRVLAVVLFGSLARGDATVMSDADVLILLSDASEPFHRRIPAFLRPGIGIAMDLFPYTLAEAHQALLEGWGVVHVAVSEGRWLVDKAAVRARLRQVME
jgi:predicted nucleotidyltransferase